MAAPGWSDGFFYHLLEITHNAGERPTAAFPSSHVGVTTVMILLACHTRCKKLIFAMLPFYILMCFATVYIFAHYAIDVIAGFITGFIIYKILRHRTKKWNSAEFLIFVNLKSNTMKNTLQRYELFDILIVPTLKFFVCPHTFLT